MSENRKMAFGRALAIVAAVVGLMLLANAATVLHAQAPTQGRDPTYSSPNADNISREGMSDGFGRMDPVQTARSLQMQRAEIRRSIAEDTTRLVQLAQELNDEIKNTQPDMLTQAELKKYAEIGKLAHKVKSEMKNLGTVAPPMQPLPGLLPVPDPNGKHQRQ